MPMLTGSPLKSTKKFMVANGKIIGHLYCTCSVSKVIRDRTPGIYRDQLTVILFIISV